MSDKPSFEIEENEIVIKLQQSDAATPLENGSFNIFILGPEDPKEALLHLARGFVAATYTIQDYLMFLGMRMSEVPDDDMEGMEGDLELHDVDTEGSA